MLKNFFALFLIIYSHNSSAALEYSKVEQPGCPENAFCQKETGIVRKKWIEELESFSKNKISEEKFNENLQQGDGIPISGWAMEEASIIPRVILWDSPCQQHRKNATKFYISETFRKNLSSSELKNFPTLYFSKAIAIDDNKKTYTYTIPRGDAPFFFKNKALYFLREEEGKYFGLLIGLNGQLRVTKVETINEKPKEGICFKEQVDHFLRESPAPNFYQGYYCKDIWDKDTKSFKTLLLGWSCN